MSRILRLARNVSDDEDLGGTVLNEGGHVGLEGGRGLVDGNNDRDVRGGELDWFDEAVQIVLDAPPVAFVVERECPS